MTQPRSQLLRCFIWFWPILVVFVASSAFAYDFQQWSSVGYDEAIKAVLRYDVGRDLTETKRARQPSSEHIHFVNSVKFLAAEGGTYSAIGSTGRVGEQYLQTLGGESQVYFPTSHGRGQAIVWYVCGFTNSGKCWGMVGMPRQLRIDYPVALHHVMSRGDRRENIYHDDVDRQDFLKTLAEACQKTDWQRILSLPSIARRVGLGSSKSANAKLRTWMQTNGKPDGVSKKTKSQKEHAEKTNQTKA